MGLLSMCHYCGSDWCQGECSLHTYRLLREGQYRLAGEDLVTVTREHLDQMAKDTPVPFPIVVRHDAEKVCGQVTRLFVKRPTCTDCEGRGTVLDAPSKVLDGPAYWTNCPTCAGQAALWATVDPLDLVPAFSLDPPMIHEVSVTGVPGAGALDCVHREPAGVAERRRPRRDWTADAQS